jgi:hypothetical protein
MSEELRARIIQFVRDYHGEHGRPPSVRTIAQELRFSSGRFRRDDLFTGGIAEACRLAGVPAPEARIRRTGRAGAARHRRRGRTAPIPPHDEAAPPFNPQIRTKLFELQGLLGAGDFSEALDVANAAILTLTPYAQHHRVRDVRQIMTRIETTHREEIARERRTASQWRERAEAVQRALTPFTTMLGEDFFTSEHYAKIRALHRYMIKEHEYPLSMGVMIEQIIETFIMEMKLRLYNGELIETDTARVPSNDLPSWFYPIYST